LLLCAKVLFIAAKVTSAQSALQRIGPPNKCLAQSNKTRTGVPATHKRPAEWRNFLGTANWRPRCGISAEDVRRQCKSNSY
jgi:hypothetical protein